MYSNASARDVAEVLKVAREHAGDPKLVDVDATDGHVHIDVASIGHAVDPDLFAAMSGVETIEGAPSLYHLAVSMAPVGQVVEIPFSGAKIGGGNFAVMAGPCAVEDEQVLIEIARQAKLAGAKILRGGAFKPRTSPYCFQGLGDAGLEMLRRVRNEVGIAIVTEAMEPGTLDLVSDVADIVQIGSRNMQNFPLLKAVGKQPKPVLLKRGMSATLEEWLAAAEYILSEGNPNVILCERGIRTFSRHSRHTLDIGVIPVLKERSPLPVIVDPSHATGLRSRVASMSMASMAAGADGLLVEVHIEPEKALSDSFQTLSMAEFEALMENLREMGSVMGQVV